MAMFLFMSAQPHREANELPRRITASWLEHNLHTLTFEDLRELHFTLSKTNSESRLMLVQKEMADRKPPLKRESQIAPDTPPEFNKKHPRGKGGKFAKKPVFVTNEPQPNNARSLAILKMVAARKNKSDERLVSDFFTRTKDGLKKLGIPVNDFSLRQMTPEESAQATGDLARTISGEDGGATIILQPDLYGDLAFALRGDGLNPFSVITALHEILHTAWLGKGPVNTTDEGYDSNLNMDEAIVTAVSLDLYPWLVQREGFDVSNGANLSPPGADIRADLGDLYTNRMVEVRRRSAKATKTPWTSREARLWRRRLISMDPAARVRLWEGSGA